MRSSNVQQDFRRSLREFQTPAGSYSAKTGFVSITSSGYLLVMEIGVESDQDRKRTYDDAFRTAPDDPDYMPYSGTLPGHGRVSRGRLDHPGSCVVVLFSTRGYAQQRDMEEWMHQMNRLGYNITEL